MMKTAQKIEKASRKTWLAGVGAYGEGIEKSTDTVDKLYVNGNAFIQELISRGEAIDAELKAQFNKKVKGSLMLQDKIAMLKAKLGMQSNSRDIQLEKLSTKVDNLIEVVAKLAQQQAAAKPAAKSPAKSSTTKAAAKTTAKSTTSTTKSTASKSTATTKTAAKKPAAKKATVSKPATKKATTAAKKPAAEKKD